MMNAIFDKLKWPARTLEEHIVNKISETVAIGVRAGLAEMPMVGKFVDGEEVVLEVKLPDTIRVSLQLKPGKPA